MTSCFLFSTNTTFIVTVLIGVLLFRPLVAKPSAINSLSSLSTQSKTQITSSKKIDQHESENSDAVILCKSTGETCHDDDECCGVCQHGPDTCVEAFPGQPFPTLGTEY